MSSKQREVLRRLRMEPSTSHAVVEVQLLVETGSWGPDCTITQIVEQATREAKSKLQSLVHESKDISIKDISMVHVVTRAKSEE